MTYSTVRAMEFRIYEEEKEKEMTQINNKIIKSDWKSITLNSEKILEIQVNIIDAECLN